MKLIATQTANRGKKSVTLDVYSCDNVLTFADKKNNYYKIIHITSYIEARARFYEWVIQMHEIKTNTTLYKAMNEER